MYLTFVYCELFHYQTVYIRGCSETNQTAIDMSVNVIASMLVQASLDSSPNTCGNTIH